MRIAFLSQSRRRIGGTEAYLDAVLPAFCRAGHSVAFICENDSHAQPGLIASPEGSATWCASSLGIPQVLQELARWKPDIAYAHGLANPDFEDAILGIAAGVLYVHNYYGTCISGEKSHSTATPRICQRRFGPACLLHYFPDHCGGRSPFTMWSQYRLQARRLQLMSRYRALVTNSQYLVRELAQHNLQAQCVYPFTGGDTRDRTVPPAFESDPLRLIFAGRMSSLKGGKYLLHAAVVVQRILQRKLHVTLAGDGTDRGEWARLSAQLQNNNLTFEFLGWLSPPELQSAIARSHLHVLPSIWPEPFGLSGLEAGLLGVPTVAFAVGGIPEWLKENVNGHLAPTPPTPEGLAAAIVSSLANAEHYQQLREGACAEAQHYSLTDHIARLTTIFESHLA